METKVTKAISAAVTSILRPLVRLLLRNGIPYRTFSDIAKRVYVDVATEESASRDGNSPSPVSILTGLSRKEVLRVRRLPVTGRPGRRCAVQPGARVIAGGSGTAGSATVRESGRTPFRGVPRPSGTSSRPTAGMLPPGVLDELLRVGPCNGTRARRSGCSSGRTSEDRGNRQDRHSRRRCVGPDRDHRPQYPSTRYTVFPEEGLLRQPSPGGAPRIEKEAADRGKPCWNRWTGG